MKVFENEVLKRIFGSKRDEVGENCIIRSFITCILIAKYTVTGPDLCFGL
jgi:hypothetical protein